MDRIESRIDGSNPARISRRGRGVTAARATALALAALATNITPARGDDKSWNNSAGGSFQLDTNWTPTGAPGANDNAIFDLNAANEYTVTFAADATNQQLLVRDDNTFLDLKNFTYALTAPAPAESVIISGNNANFHFDNGTLSSGAATIGKAAGANGTVHMGDNATWSLSGPLHIGESGNGTLFDVFTGAVKGTSLAIGVEAGSNGLVSGIGKFDFSGGVQVGVHGQGRIQAFDSSGPLNCQTLDLGVFAGSSGRITGLNLETHVTGLLRVGVAGSGVWDASEIVGPVSSASAILGEKSGSFGHAILGDFSDWETDTTLDLGLGGKGVMEVFGESSLTSGAIRIGVLKGSDGSLIVDSDDGASTWITNGDITVGDAGKGRVSIRSVEVSNQTAEAKGDVFIARQDGSDGVAVVSADEFGDVTNLSSTWNIKGGLFIAGDKNAGHTGTGTLSIEQISTVNVGAGTTVWAKGKIQLERNSTFSSPDGVQLRGGTLAGDGKVVGDVTSQGGHIAPMNESRSTGRFNAGILVIDGMLSLDSKSTLEFGLGGTTPGAPPIVDGQKLPGGYDVLKVGDLNLSDGTLKVGFFNGFENEVKSSDLFTILDANNPLVGIFANIANGHRLKTTDGLFTFKVNYGEGSAFDPSDVVLSDAQPFTGPAVPLPPMVWSGGAMLAGLVATRVRMNRRSRA